MGTTFFLLALLLQSICVSSAPPYTVTQYIRLSAGYTATYRDAFTSVSRSTYEYTFAVTPTGTPTNGIRTIVDTTSMPEVTIVNIVLPEESKSSTSYDYDAYTRSTRSSYVSTVSTNYVVPVTYTPSANCSQKWTHVTNVPIALPSILQGVITPVGVATTTQSFVYFTWDPLTSIQATLAATDVPSSLLSYASLVGKPYGLTSCAKPTTSCYTTTRASSEPKVTSCSVYFNSEYDNDDTSTYDSSSTSSGRRRKSSFDSAWRRYVMIIIIVAAVWTALWLFVGMVQSWQSFKGLMQGQRERRGTPYAWGFVSCWCWCFMGPTYKAKSEEEQEILKARWLEMKSSEKFKLYMKWGMKWSYPDVLGSEPEIDKKAWRARKFSL